MRVQSFGVFVLVLIAFAVASLFTTDIKRPLRRLAKSDAELQRQAIGENAEATITGIEFGETGDPSRPHTAIVRVDYVTPRKYLIDRENGVSKWGFCTEETTVHLTYGYIGGTWIRERFDEQTQFVGVDHAKAMNPDLFGFGPRKSIPVDQFPIHLIRLPCMQ